MDEENLYRGMTSRTQQVATGAFLAVVAVLVLIGTVLAQSRPAAIAQTAQAAVSHPRAAFSLLPTSTR